MIIRDLSTMHVTATAGVSDALVFAYMVQYSTVQYSIVVQLCAIEVQYSITVGFPRSYTSIFERAVFALRSRSIL